MDGEETDACWIDACHDEVCADVALIAEEMLLEHSHDCDDTRSAASGEGVQFEVGGDESGGELGISSCTCASAPDRGGDEVQLFAVLVGDDGPGSGTSVGCYLEKSEHWLGCLEAGDLTTTPFSYIHPTMVVPVLVAFGRGTPRA